MKFLSILLFLILSACTTVEQKPVNRIDEINDYWTEVSRCVGEGDFEGYKATCHKEGTLVAGTIQKAHPLSKALANWKHEFDDTKSGKIQAGVIFRLAKRLGDETRAHETGMFLYFQVKQDGKKNIEYIHLDALLVKTADGWKMMMEHQRSKGTKADWDKLSDY
jgi:hypothetical protein